MRMILIIWIWPHFRKHNRSPSSGFACRTADVFVAGRLDRPEPGHTETQPYPSANRRGMHVVWFKRDLRVRDHAPLAEAARAGRVLPLYVFEPEVIGAPTMPPSTSSSRASASPNSTAISKLPAPL